MHHYANEENDEDDDKEGVDQPPPPASMKGRSKVVVSWTPKPPWSPYRKLRRGKRFTIENGHGECNAGEREKECEDVDNDIDE